MISAAFTVSAGPIAETTVDFPLVAVETADLTRVGDDGLAWEKVGLDIGEENVDSVDIRKTIGLPPNTIEVYRP